MGCGRQNIAHRCTAPHPRATEKEDWMNYGGNSQDEMEVTIRIGREDRQAYICSTWPEWSRKLERWFGCPRKETHRGDCITSAFWTVPLALVAMRLGTRSGREGRRCCPRRPGVHDDRSGCSPCRSRRSRWSDPRVHDAPICVFTMGRRPPSGVTRRLAAPPVDSEKVTWHYPDLRRFSPGGASRRRGGRLPPPVQAANSWRGAVESRCSQGEPRWEGVRSGQ
jgi:hypothetical protein